MEDDRKRLDWVLRDRKCLKLAEPETVPFVMFFEKNVFVGSVLEKSSR